MNIGIGNIGVDKARGRRGFTTVDARQSLSDATWSDEGGGVYKTTVTLTTAHVAGGLGSNTTNFGVWLGDEFGSWKVGGASIAANVAAVAATTGVLAFAVNVTGNAGQDIRSVAATTGPFDLYVKMPDGLSPEGRAVMCSDKGAVATLSGVTTSKRRYIGGFGKDHVNIDQTTPSTMIGCEILDFGEHGSVGPLNVVNHRAVGRPRPGITVGSALGQSQGAALHFYNSNYLSTADLTINGAWLENADKAIFCHGGTNQAYRSLTIHGAPVTIRNCRQGIIFNAVPTTLLPMFADGVTCTAPIDFTGVEQAFYVDGEWSFTGGGSVEMTPTTTAPKTVLVSFVGAAPSMVLKDTVIKGNKANSWSYRNVLCARGSAAGFATPTLTLDNVLDDSIRANRFTCQVGSANSRAVHLVLTGGTVLQNMEYDASETGQWPASLTVDAGCTFGWGNRTGAQIRTALDALSIPHNISNQTTILNINGTVASAPGW